MKRAILIFISLILIIGVFSGCGMNSAEVSPSSDIFQTQVSSQSTVSNKASSKEATSLNTSSQKSVTTSKKSVATPYSSYNVFSPSQNTTSKITTSQKKAPQKIIFSSSNKNSDKVKTVGRVAFENSYGLSMFYTGSSVELNADCEGDMVVGISCTENSKSRLKIYIDGQLYGGGITTLTGSASLTVATGLEKGVHNLKLVRSDDCEMGRISLSFIEINGALAEKPGNKSLYIKALGGSQVIGWGNLLSDDWFKNEYDQSTARDRTNQDGTLTYPMVAARLLDADISVVGRQSAGIAVTWHTNEAQGILENLYSITAPKLNSAYTQTREADVILIDDGAADINAALYSKCEINYSDVILKTLSFLNKLRADHPKAKIIWCYGIDHDCETKLFPEGTQGIAISSEEHIKLMLSKMGGEARGYYSLRMDYNPTRKGYPSVSEHNAAGIKVAQKIQELLN